MTGKKIWSSAAARVERGSALLAAAEFVDVRLIRDRFDAFADAHGTYAAAHRAVEAAEATLRAGQESVLARDGEQDAAVEELARALVTERQPRHNPFAVFGLPSPSRIQSMAMASEAKAIHQLVAAVQRNAAISETTRRAALAAESAAQAVEMELGPLQKLQANVRSTRAARSAAERPWNQALAVLKQCARIAAEQGAPALYEALFGPPNRAKKQPPTTDTAPDPAGEVKPAATQ